MAAKKKNPSQKSVWIGAGVVVVLMAILVSVAVKVLLSDEMQQNKRKVHQVKLLKPPKPPEVKKKPPPPKKKEKKIEKKVEKEEPKPQEQKQADKPRMDENLGLDAEGSPGSDGFGLQAKKGGSSIIGGGGGNSSLLRKYAWYNQILEKAIRKKVNEIFEQNGGLPKGNLKTVVDVYLNESGKIVRFDIHRSSGHQEMDQTVKKALQVTELDQTPPQGMPKGIRITISARG